MFTYYQQGENEIDIFSTIFMANQSDSTLSWMDRNGHI